MNKNDVKVLFAILAGGATAVGAFIAMHRYAENKNYQKKQEDLMDEILNKAYAVRSSSKTAVE